MISTELYLDVRYYETDQMGIVHHSNYVRYFECGRTDMLKQLGLPMEKIEASGIMMPVVSIECKYKIPAKLGDTLRIVSIINEEPGAKMTIRSEIYNQDGVLNCEGAVVIGFIDSETRRPVRCPQIFKDMITTNLNK
jgi:acyl-CoA thioester hydrolase